MPAGQHHIEAERKYALAPGQELPDLSSVVVPGPVADHQLVATYYDAPDFRLTRARLVIRHRVGGTDAGWHLKRPGDAAHQREELQLPPGPRRVPEELRALVADTLAGAPLVPVAVLRTRRHEQQLLDAEGRLLAVACTDDVSADVGRRRGQAWREAEIELGRGDVGLLDRIETVLAAAGIRPAAGPSKIGRALESVIEANSVPGPDSSAAGLITAYLAEQVGVLQNREADVRVDSPDAVHRTRVATRRLRSSLRTYGELLAENPTRLRGELRWYAEHLGAPRDAEVLRERLATTIAQLDSPARAVLTERSEARLNQVHADAHANLVAAMATPRYEQLQLALAELLSRPRWVLVAEQPASVVLPGLFDQAVARARKLARHAQARPSDLTRWHEVRKAAKAVRYAAELLVPALGAQAEAWRNSWEAVTEAFGQMQDAVVAQQLIGDLAWAAVGDGLPRLPFDDLRHAEDAELRAALERGRAALAAALA